MNTAKEATELWCPMVRIVRRETELDGSISAIIGGCNTDALGHNRIPASCLCVADKCAMWRWVPKRGPAPAPPPHIRGTLPMPAPIGERIDPTHGYCGLAGAPCA